MSELNEQIANCPFCGSVARVECHFGVDYWVQCTNMNCASTNGKTTTYRAHAIAAWNRRSPASPAVQPPADVLEQAHGALNAMLNQFTRVPSTGADSEVRKLGHAAIASIDAAVAASTVPAAPADYWLHHYAERIKHEADQHSDEFADIMRAIAEEMQGEAAGQPPAQPALQADAGADAKDAASVIIPMELAQDIYGALHWRDAYDPDAYQRVKTRVASLVQGAALTSADEVKGDKNA